MYYGLWENLLEKSYNAKTHVYKYERAALNRMWSLIPMRKYISVQPSLYPIRNLIMLLFFSTQRVKNENLLLVVCTYLDIRKKVVM